MPSKEEIEEVVDKAYSLDNLKKLYRDYLYNFDKNNETKLDFKDISFSQQKLQKKELTKILAEVYMSPEYFSKLLTYLPKDVIKVFKMFVWEGGKYKLEELEKDLELKMLLANSSGNKFINASYLFFNFEKISSFNSTNFDYKVTFPSLIRDLVRDSFDTPLGYHLEPVKEPEGTQFVQKNNSSVIKYIQLYYNYVNGGNISFSKQDKISKVSMKNMKEYCEIKEFYGPEDKELEFIKTEIIIQYLRDITINQQQTNLELLKSLVFKFIDPNVTYFLDNLLPHIRGKGNDFRQNEDYKSRNLEVRKAVFSLIKELPQEEWISIESIEKFASYRNLFLQLFDESFAENSLYFDEMKRTSNSYTFSQKTYIKDDLYKEIIILPLIKASMFLFSALGIIDIAYDKPTNNSYRQKSQEYLSIFDGLKFIKLNDLGSFVAGYTETVEVEEEKEEIEIKLDEDRLLLTTFGNNKFVSLFIESISEKIADNKYKISFSSFLSNCNDKDELENKIKTFKAEISSTLPWLWTDFFNKLVERTNLFQKKTDMEIFKITDKEIIKIIAEDKVLKSLILKVENFFVAIKTTDLTAVKKRLEEFGYLI
ncbi:MAG: hypothetical protein H7263_18085 [Candidatus Sericytochromatia bacterium]|nr:hypothetical protein [Candidatus Sericytochromatia bacterium]